MENEKWYGIVRWHIQDVIETAKFRGIEMTEDEAHEWWSKNEEHFKNRMVELGMETLGYMI